MKGLSNQSLGKYELRQEIGHGSMGTVYLAIDTFSGQRYAIKVANPDSSKPEKLARRHRKLFFNEARAAGLLRHPNIVGVQDAGVEDGVRYIVMEFVPKHETLADYCMPETLLPVEHVVEIMLKCAIAFDYAHRKGVVHRDIKPKNILLTSEHEVKVADFGIALITQAEQAEDTQVHGYLGSPLYMSPEQARGESISNQADIFCIGVVLYELLTGRHPFAAETLPAISHRITHEAHVPVQAMRPELPEIFAQIVDRTLKKHPAGRYATALDLAGDLGLIYDHIQVQNDDLTGREKYSRAAKLSFFGDFAENEIWEVINASLWQDFGDGEEIIAAGEDVTSFFVLVSGSVNIRRNDKDVDRLEAGACFGEVGYITKRSRSASVVAAEAVTVMKVRATLIERTTQGCQLQVHRAFMSTMADRLERATEIIAEWDVG
ncbi:MAG: serine/threonine-protein kinase [Pseudomonadota bacterium]